MYRLCFWNTETTRWVTVDTSNDMDDLISFANRVFVESTRLIIHDNETGEVYKEWLVPGYLK